MTTWNPAYRKLTTSDQRGLIIVWMMHKGSWFEEMINNRNKSVVKDMRWRSNGQEIAIAYEDGMVIVGGVDGNRIWSKDMGAVLSLVEWAPDGRQLLFVAADGQVLVHNHQGVRLGSVPLPAVADLPPGSVRVSALEWYDGAEGSAFFDAPSLAVAFENGRVQIMRGPEDDGPVLIDTGLRLTHAKWNPSGTVLALAGTPIAAGAADAASSSAAASAAAEVQFYSCLGRYSTTLRIPGGAISSLSWDGGGLRLAVRKERPSPTPASASAPTSPPRYPPPLSPSPRSLPAQLAVESFVYFANVRPQYRWASFGDTVVYAFAKPDRAEQCVVFWSTKTNER